MYIYIYIYKGGDSDSPIKTAKCSFLRTNMQCGFIKVIRMRRGSSNCKMIVSSLNVFCYEYKYNHRTCPMAIRLVLLESGQHFADYFILFPNKLQRLLNTLQTIIRTKDQFFSLYSSIWWSHKKYLYWSQTQFREHTALCISQMQFVWHINSFIHRYNPACCQF